LIIGNSKSFHLGAQGTLSVGILVSVGSRMYYIPMGAITQHWRTDSIHSISGHTCKRSAMPAWMHLKRRHLGLYRKSYILYTNGGEPSIGRREILYSISGHTCKRSAMTAWMHLKRGHLSLCRKSYILFTNGGEPSIGRREILYSIQVVPLAVTWPLHDIVLTR